MQVDPVYGFGRRIRLVRVLRWVLVALSLALATVLLLRHDYVIGSLIAVLVVVRVAILMGTTRRRRPYMRTSRSPGQPAAVPTASGATTGGTLSGAPRPGGRALSGLARSEFLVAAGVIGMAPAQMRDAYDSGNSLAEMAATKGVPVDRILSAVVTDAGLKIDDAVAQGTMNPRFAARFKSRLPIFADRIVNHHKRDLQRAR
jgi:hypothetical protein